MLASHIKHEGKINYYYCNELYIHCNVTALLVKNTR